MRHHHHLITCVVLLGGPACVDLTRPHTGRDGGGEDAATEQPRDGVADLAPEGPDTDGGGGGADAGDAGDGGGDGSTLGNGLIGYWKLDSNANAQAVDSSGMGNHGIIRGVPAVVGPPLPPVRFTDTGAFSFATADDAVEVTDRASLRPSQFSIAAWVRFANSASVTTRVCGGIPTGQQFIVHRRTMLAGSGAEAIALMRTQDGRFAFALGDNTGNRTFVDGLVGGSQSVATGIWYHVAGTFDGAQVRLYINGAVQGTAARTVAVEYGTRSLFLGRSGDCARDGLGDVDWDAPLNGALDDVRFYDRALGGLDVKALYEGSD